MVKTQISRLDDVAVSHEVRWGIGRLEQLASPELRVKWDRQVEKVNAAIRAQDINGLYGLVEGSIKGWAALEADALAQGHKPNDAQYWEIKLPESEFTYRVYKTTTDAHSSAPEGVIRYSMAEVARILEGHQLVNAVKKRIGGEVKKVTIAPFGEDDIPF